MGIGRSVEIEPSMGISAEKSVDGITIVVVDGAESSGLEMTD
jgi:hypothetical protein